MLVNSKEVLLSNEVSEANLNAYQRSFNWQPFMKRVYSFKKEFNLVRAFAKSIKFENFSQNRKSVLEGPVST